MSWCYSSHAVRNNGCVHPMSEVPSVLSSLTSSSLVCRVVLVLSLSHEHNGNIENIHLQNIRTDRHCQECRRILIKIRLIVVITMWHIKIRDSAVGIATGYGQNDREVGVQVPVGSRIFTSPSRPDLLWGPPSLLFNGYWGLFPRGKAGGAWSWPITSN
jgi:hypothetical protein